MQQSLPMKQSVRGAGNASNAMQVQLKASPNVSSKEDVIIAPPSEPAVGAKAAASEVDTVNHTGTVRPAAPVDLPLKPPVDPIFTTVPSTAEASTTNVEAETPTASVQNTAGFPLKNNAGLPLKNKAGLPLNKPRSDQTRPSSDTRCCGAPAPADGDEKPMKPEDKRRAANDKAREAGKKWREQAKTHRRVLHHKLGNIYADPLEEPSNDAKIKLKAAVGSTSEKAGEPALVTRQGGQVKPSPAADTKAQQHERYGDIYDLSENLDTNKDTKFDLPLLLSPRAPVQDEPPVVSQPPDEPPKIDDAPKIDMRPPLPSRTSTQASVQGDGQVLGNLFSQVHEIDNLVDEMKPFVKEDSPPANEPHEGEPHGEFDGPELKS
eukprot:COSAG05_NODE_63_length_22889_cov_41.986617_17_plen_378_part_00